MLLAPQIIYLYEKKKEFLSYTIILISTKLLSNYSFYGTQNKSETSRCFSELQSK